MRIVGLQKVTLLDYPGQIAASVFLAGCNLNCGYCHNRWMIAADKESGQVAPEVISVGDLLRWLGTRQGLLDGVCISGGEPTLSAGLPDLLRGIRGLGMAIKLDTNGTRPGRLAALMNADLVDMVAVDLKAPLDARYALVAGTPVDVGAIRETMALLRGWATPDGARSYEFRTTVGPQLSEAWLRDIAAELRQEEAWYLQEFRPAEGVDPALVAGEWPSGAALEALAGRLASVAAGVRVRGLQA